MADRKHGWAVAICVCLWLIYAVLAWTSAAGKSATFDEPNHAAIGWLALHRGDFRPSPDVPALWEYWISLPLVGMHFDPADPLYRNVVPDRAACIWTDHLLYQTPGNDGVAIVQRCRAMSLVLSVMLGVVISWWTWKLAGPVAAVAATAVWAFDPSFLGHGALAKNDIPMALVYAWLAFALWSVGRRMSWVSAVSLCLAIAIAPGIKLSGLVCGPVAALVLFCRAMLPWPWPVVRWIARSRAGRLAAACTLMIVAGIASYGVLWASYGFRFLGSPADLPMNISVIERTLIHRAATSATAGPQPDWSVRFLNASLEHHWLPQAWIAGALLSKLNSFDRLAYVCGDIYRGGRWYYFPVAFVFKEPVATLAILMVAMVALLAGLRRGIGGNPAFQWAVLALGIPAGVYLAGSMSADMNLGIRYLFPLYPFLFVGAGAAAARVWSGGWAGRAVLGILAVGLITETAAAFPNYIAYFNVACGGSTGGYGLLADSNLDWGQDLPLLADWQKRNSDQRLYIQYFGLCEPSAYGIHAAEVPGGTGLDATPQWPKTGGVVAISAWYLQVNSPDSFSWCFRDVRPDEILGGSIYLFHFATPPPRPPPGHAEERRGARTP